MATPSRSSKKFKQSKRKTITKFIHEWLPLQDCHYVRSALSTNLPILPCHTRNHRTSLVMSAPQLPSNLDWIWGEYSQILS